MLNRNVFFQALGTVLGIGLCAFLLAACDDSVTVSATAPDAPALRTALAGSQPVAQIKNGVVEPIMAEEELKDFFVQGFARAEGETRLARLDEAWVEQSGDYHYLMGKGFDSEGNCLTLSLELDVVEGAATATEIEIKFIFVVACLGTTCPQSGCVPIKDENGRILDCMCIPAGECIKTIIPIPIPF